VRVILFIVGEFDDAERTLQQTAHYYSVACRARFNYFHAQYKEHLQGLSEAFDGDKELTEVVQPVLGISS
jgi:hypothetical protein